MPHKDLANNVMDQNETSGQLPEATSMGGALYGNVTSKKRVPDGFLSDALFGAENLLLVAFFPSQETDTFCVHRTR